MLSSSILASIILFYYCNIVNSKNRNNTESASVTKFFITHHLIWATWYLAIISMSDTYPMLEKRLAIWKLLKFEPFFVHYFDFMKFEVESNVKSPNSCQLLTVSDRISRGIKKMKPQRTILILFYFSVCLSHNNYIMYLADFITFDWNESQSRAANFSLNSFFSFVD